MDTVAFKSKKPFSIPSIQDTLSKHWPVDLSACDTTTVRGTNSRVYLHPHFEDEMHELWLDYSDIELVKKVIEKIADDPSIVIDNDFGTVLPGNEFVARIRNEPEWNWRND